LIEDVENNAHHTLDVVWSEDRMDEKASGELALGV
jgi:hypothetical protein